MFDKILDWWYMWVLMLPLTLTKERPGLMPVLAGVIIEVPWIVVVLVVSSPFVMIMAIGSLIKDELCTRV